MKAKMRAENVKISDISLHREDRADTQRQHTPGKDRQKQ